MDLDTKNGKPLQVAGEFVYSRSVVPVGRIKGDRVFGPDGRYVGSLVGDRLIFRSTQSAAIDSPFSVAHRAGSAKADRAGSAVWGDEPNMPD